MEENIMKLFGTQKIMEDTLHIGGVSVKDLAEKYGTPLYVMDEEEIRSKAKVFREGFMHPEIETEVIYASKAFMTKSMAKLIHEEGLSLDVVSGGELYTALSAGYPAEKIYFHGNNKSVEEIELAIESRVGTIMVDNRDEMNRIIQTLTGSGRSQRVILRVNPGIEAHTHEYISTTKNDSKFGVSIFSKDTVTLIKEMEDSQYIDFRGIHCHIGSQIFEEESFEKAAEMMVEYMAALRDKGIFIKELNLGGGFGVQYVTEDTPMNYQGFLPGILDKMISLSTHHKLTPPKMIIEPGRALVANAGITLYKVGGTKKTFSGKNYVFVDGSMADHIRTALYDASYTAHLAERMNEEALCSYTVTGKACESGDIIIKNITLPEPKTGDLMAVLSTGAYHYSMASNYNRLTKPPVVFVRNGKSRLVVKRESYEDLIRNDVEEEYEA